MCNKQLSKNAKVRHARSAVQSNRVLEIRTGASSLLRNLVFGPHYALLPSFIRGMPTFSSSLTYPMEQSGKHVALHPSFCSPPPRFSFPPLHLVFLSSDLRIATPFFSSLSSEARCLSSVLLFPFQLDAFANLCPRPLLYSIFRFPAFIERDTLAESLGRVPIGKIIARSEQRNHNRK